jgi:hypothetical protein
MRAENRANEPTASAARHLNRANEATIIGVEKIAPIGRIAPLLRREGMARAGKTKPR